MIGRTLGHHRIIDQLGKGGMGVVYLAEDTRLGRRVALKVLPPDLASDPARRARFEREARAVAALNHPNIVTIHSVEQAEGVHFLTMELVDGRRLTEALSRDGLPLSRLLEWSMGIADALGAAHRQGVVHRDLKPDNVMITSAGRVKVLDFGLAKLREPAAEQGQTGLATASVTEEGKILGTVSYMSPEQAEGKPLDHRSDIFSFGILLYEMATGRKPFQGDTPISTISSILKDTPPSPQQINTALPPQLGRIVRRCLAKEPDRRFQSTDDLRNELQDLEEESGSGELTMEGRASAEASAGAVPRRRGGARTLLLAGVLMAVVAAAVAAWLWQGGLTAPASPDPSRGSFQLSRATNDGRVAEAAISPDGRYVAYVRREGSRYSLRLRQVTTGEEVQVVAPAETTLTSPAFSGDGDFLHYVEIQPDRQSGWVQRVSVLGGTPRRIVDGAYAVAPSPDGRQLAIAGVAGLDSSSLRLTGPDGGTPRDLARREGRDHFDSRPAWSSDGGTLAIVSHRYGEPQQIVLIDPATGAERPLAVPALRSINSLSWMPGKRSLVLTGSEQPVNRGAPPQIWEVSMEGEATALTRDLNGYQGASVTGDGATLATVQIESRSGIDVADVRNGLPGAFRELLPISAARAGGGGMAWLTRDTLLHTGVQGDSRQIFLTDVASGQSRPITSGVPHEVVTISRDGRTVVVQRNEGDRTMLWSLEPDTWRGKQLTEGPFDAAPVVGPDGASVAYTSVSETIQLLRKPVSGGEPVTLLREAAWCADSSIDARLGCLRILPSGEAQAFLIPMAGGEPVAVSEVPGASKTARFNADGRTLSWLVTQDGADEIWGQVPGKAEPRRIARFEGKEISDFVWSADGTRLAVVKQSRSGDVVLLRQPSSSPGTDR